jgi:DNA (cytosine-5)-methyltransferase 1
MTEGEFTFGSLFSGIGGIDLGFERAGMTCKWQVEINDFCQKVLAKHWPDVRRYRDVREVGKHNLEPVDLIAGGFPCQPHSVAGKRRGKDDDRNLWPEYLRIIREIKPTWVVGENVPGIITTMLDDVLSDLECAGYAPTVFNIPACAFGANHIRYRIFIVAYAIGNGYLYRKFEKQSTKRGQQAFAESLGSCEPLADANETGLQAERPKQQAAGFAREDTQIPYATSQRCKPRTIERGTLSEEFGRAEFDLGNQPQNRRDGRPTESDLGGMVDGLSAGLDGNWRIEPDIPRVAKGIKNRVDRLKSLGNAVVPQVAEYIGRCIMEAENDHAN